MMVIFIFTWSAKKNPKLCVGQWKLMSIGISVVSFLVCLLHMSKLFNIIIILCIMSFSWSQLKLKTKKKYIIHNSWLRLHFDLQILVIQVAFINWTYRIIIGFSSNLNLKSRLDTNLMNLVKITDASKRKRNKTRNQFIFSNPASINKLNLMLISS